jgi:hypothetical protein
MLTADNPVDRHKERLAAIGNDSERYIAELEWIIYTSVNLSDIMREGHSEDTYRSIHEKYEPKQPTATAD